MAFGQAVLVDDGVNLALKVVLFFGVHLTRNRGFALTHLCLQPSGLFAQVGRSCTSFHLGNQRGVLCGQVHERFVQRLLGVALLGRDLLGQLFNVLHDALVLNCGRTAFVVQGLQLPVRVCTVLKQRLLPSVIQSGEQVSAFALDALEPFAGLAGTGIGGFLITANTSTVLQHVDQLLALTEVLVKRGPQRHSIGMGRQIIDQLCVVVCKGCLKQVGWTENVQHGRLEQWATHVLLCPRHGVLRLVERVHRTEDFGCVFGLDGFVQRSLCSIDAGLCSIDAGLCSLDCRQFFGLVGWQRRSFRSRCWERCNGLAGRRHVLDAPAFWLCRLIQPQLTVLACLCAESGQLLQIRRTGLQLTNLFGLRGSSIEVANLQQAQALFLGRSQLLGKLFFCVCDTTALFNNRGHLPHAGHQLAALLRQLCLGVEVWASGQLLLQRSHLAAQGVVVVHQTCGV